MSWEQVTTSTITPAILESLFANEVGAVRVPGFLPADTCRLAVDGILRHGFEQVSTSIGKIGVTQSSHIGAPGRKAEYFRKAVEANATRRTVFAGSGDLLYRVIDFIASGWPVGCAQAVEQKTQKEYFAGLVRVIRQSFLHLDWAPFDAPGWTISNISAQLAWNIYLQVSTEGGATVVYRRLWREEDEAHQVPNDHWPTITIYDPALVEACERVEVRPRRGELVFFNSRNFHEVTTAREGIQRITVSSFIGLVEPSGQLLFWS